MVLLTASFAKVYCSVMLSCLDFLQQFWLIFCYFFFWQNVLFFLFYIFILAHFGEDTGYFWHFASLTPTLLSIYLENWKTTGQIPTMHVIMIFHNKRSSKFNHWTRLSWTSFAKGIFFLGSAHEFTLQPFFHEYVRKVAIAWVYDLLLYQKSHDRTVVVVAS